MAGRPRTIPDAEVLAAAEAVLRDDGPGALSLAAVARRCGLSPAAIQRRFNGKHGLLLALFERAVQRWRDRFEEAEGEDGRAVLLAALCADAAEVSSPRDVAWQLQGLADDLLDPARSAPLRDMQRAFEREVCARVQAAMADGSVPCGDPHAVALALMDARVGALLRWAVAPEGRAGAAVRGALESVLA